ncbi:MAG: hypothetical protein CR981_03525 [Proteobacteria bacterium]|nr:MAG: hypothetical protein CR981_03525 [Pseudomonadota bacterium]
MTEDTREHAGPGRGYEKASFAEDHRLEDRQLSVENMSVEFQPGEAELPYHFKVRDYSARGLGILVKEDSRILEMLHVGDVLEMKYYQGDERPVPVNVKTRIQHITKPEGGRFPQHLIVGLHIGDPD